jgi:hypothetical protein
MSEFSGRENVRENNKSARENVEQHWQLKVHEKLLHALTLRRSNEFLL